MTGKPRVTRDLPHPVLFTQGSRWRFKTRRMISDVGHHFEIGDEIECETPINNVSKTLACSGAINRFLRRSDETKFASNPKVRGTVDMNTVYRFVEQVKEGTPVVYYLCKQVAKDGARGMGYYFSGKDRNYPNVHDFSEAAYWENRLFALKALFRENGFGTRRKYEHYKLMAYDVRTDEHTEISTAHVHAASQWLHEQTNQRVAKAELMKALSDSILKDFDAFTGLIVVRMPDFGTEAENTLKRYCNQKKMRKPIGFLDRLAFFGSLDDAMLIKMGLQGYEVIVI